MAYQYDRVKNPYFYHYETNAHFQVSPSAYQNIILIIDESLRADYSPSFILKTLKHWKVYDYGTATSYANSSAPSNVLLRKGARFETIVQDFYQNPLIWFYAKQAGYKTYLIDAQGGGRGHNYFDSTERSMIDFILDPKIINEDDVKILNQLSYLNEKQKTFTIIIKYGSHFPYQSCPNGYQATETPSKYQAQTATRLKYFNNVSYQVYNFWRAFSSININQPTLIIYTSDHGQNLEDTQGLTHGNTSNPYEGEGLVPLIVLSNIPNNDLEKNLKFNYNNASHFNIVPTILDSMGYSSIELKYNDYNSSLLYKTKKVNGFFYGIPFGYFGKHPDFLEFKK